jgi:hypothetical protein
MAIGRIRRDCRLEADGAERVRLQAMKGKFLRRTFSNRFAIWVTPMIARGRLASAFGMRCDLRRVFRAGIVLQVRMALRASSNSGMFVSALIGPWNMGFLNTI